MESNLKGTRKMNIKISKRRAAQIMAEEIEAFIEQNKDLDPKILREHIKTHFSSKENV
jgi:hypothetical protein